MNKETTTYTLIGRTTVDDTVDIVQVGEALKDSERYLPNDIDINGSDLLVDTVEGALIHELHADADVRVGDEGAVERDDVL